MQYKCSHCQKGVVDGLPETCPECGALLTRIIRKAPMMSLMEFAENEAIRDVEAMEDQETLRILEAGVKALERKPHEIDTARGAGAADD